MKTLSGQWVLNPLESSIRLKTKLMGMISVAGVFREVSGDGTVSPDGEVSGTLTVGAASIDTKNARRDTHLRSADFFDTDKNPDITFTADGFRPSGQGGTLAGALTMRDRTRALSFDVATSIQSEHELWLDALVHVNRADFGITWNPMGLASMSNAIAIHAVFIRR